MNSNRLETRNKEGQAGIVKLLARLLTVAGFVRQESHTVDVGANHDYISVCLAQTGRISSVLAMDVRYGPLERAQTHVRECQVWERTRRQVFPAVPTKARPSGGPKELKPGEAGTVIIAGMGGEPIIKILGKDRHVWDGVKQCILSPQSDLDKARRYLVGHGFVIEDEAMAEDGGKYYTMMGVKRGFTKYENQAHYLYGRLLIGKKDIILRKYLNRETLRIEKILESFQEREGITSTESRAGARISKQKELPQVKETQGGVQ